MSSFFPPVEWVLFPVVKCVDSHDSLLLLCVCVYIHFLSSDNGKMASIRAQVCFLVPHHFTQHPTRGSTPSKPSTLEQRRHVLLASGVQGHIPCRAAMPLKKPSPLNCYLQSSQVLSCTPTYAHLHIFTHLLPHSLATHPTLQGSVSEFCLLNTIIFSDPGSLWLPLLATELARIKLGLHLFSGCFMYVNLVSLFSV